MSAITHKSHGRILYDRGKSFNEDYNASQNLNNIVNRSNIQSRMKREVQERRFQEIKNYLNYPKSQLPTQLEYPDYSEHFQAKSQVKRVIPVDLKFGPIQTDKLSEFSRIPVNVANNKEELQSRPSAIEQRFFRNNSTSHIDVLPTIPGSDQSFQAFSEPLAQFNQRNRSFQEQERENFYQKSQLKGAKGVVSHYDPPNTSQYEHSAGVNDVFKGDFVKEVESGTPNDWKWDNNARGKRMKEEYNRFVNLELEKQKYLNPLLHRRFKERSLDLSSENEEFGDRDPKFVRALNQNKVAILRNVDASKSYEQSKADREYQRVRQKLEVINELQQPDISGWKQSTATMPTHNANPNNFIDKVNSYDFPYNAISNHVKHYRSNSQSVDFLNDILDEIRQHRDISKPENNSMSPDNSFQNLEAKKPNISALDLSSLKNSQSEAIIKKQNEDKKTRQVPGIGANYYNRDVLEVLKKQRISEDLQTTYQQQIADKHRRLLEEKLREQEEEQKAEEKAKKELEDMALAYKAEKNFKKANSGLIYKDFNPAKEETSGTYDQLRVVNRKKVNITNASTDTKNKLNKSNSGKLGSNNQTFQHTFTNQNSYLQRIHEKHDNKLDVRILDDSALEQKNTSTFEEKKSPKVLKGIEDERFDLLKKDLATRTTTLQEQRVALRIEAASTQTMKNEAFRELLRLKEELEQKRILEESKGKEIYQYHSKASLYKSSTQQKIKIPDVPILKPNRNYNKTLGPMNDYEMYYKNMKGPLEEISQLVPLGESPIISYHPHLETPSPRLGKKPEVTAKKQQSIDLSNDDNKKRDEKNVQNKSEIHIEEEEAQHHQNEAGSSQIKSEAKISAENGLSKDPEGDNKFENDHTEQNQSQYKEAAEDKSKMNSHSKLASYSKLPSQSELQQVQNEST